MVPPEKGSTQTGHMVLQEDGAILSSSGELASKEGTSAQLMNLTYHTFSAAPLSKGYSTAAGNQSQMNGDSSGNHGLLSSANSTKSDKWNRVSVCFGSTSYSACLSNRKVFVARRENLGNSTE